MLKHRASGAASSGLFGSLFIASSLLVTSLAAATLSGCGSDGGGDDFVGSADARIAASPTKVDTGDRTRLTISLQNIDANGISVKVRFPAAFAYVLDSSWLETSVSKDAIDVDPQVVQSAEGETYVVYYFSQRLFYGGREEYNGESGTLTLELEASTRLNRARVAVDTDVDDPLIDNTVEFDVQNPEFEPQDETVLEID